MKQENIIYNMKYLKLFEDHKEHCYIVKKYMKYFSSKRMNKLAWWIDPFHLPRINEMLCESISYYDNDYHGDGYQFSPWSSSDPYIRNVPKDDVPIEIREIMDLVDCDYITWCTTDHNYGYLMGYSKKGMSHSKSLDPDDIDEDEFAQKILKTLIDKKYLIDPDENKRRDYIDNIKAKKIAKKYNL